MADLPGMSKGLVTLSEIETAATRIQGVAVATPLLPFPELSDAVGGEIRLKCESLQRSGSFKLRGALNFVAQIPAEALQRGVITYSSGNHGKAMALAARSKGVRAVVVMPTTAPEVKVEGTREFGAEVVFAGTTSVHRQARAEELAESQGLTMVPPFDHPWIIAGQGTVGREIAMEWPEVDAVLAPVGGGGLSSGIAAALKAILPAVRFIGVEAEGAPGMRRALDAGEPVLLDRGDTIADGIRTLRVGDLTYQHARALFDDVVLVKDEAIREAAALLLGGRKLVVEYSGAAALAAILSRVVEAREKRIAVVLSGGNLDPSLLEPLSREPSSGFMAEGRVATSPRDRA
jgi:threonine dehydratase